MGRYVTTAQLKEYVKSTTVDDEDLYDLAIAGAEQYLDNATGRRIALASNTVTARVFRLPGPERSVLFIDDCTEITSVVDNVTTLTANVDYVAEPLNGITTAGEARPYDTLTRVSAWWHYDDAKPTVTVNAKWGWPAIPDMAKTACIILAKAYLDNRELAFGVVGATESGAITEREAKTVSDFVRQYRSVRSFGIA